MDTPYFTKTCCLKECGTEAKNGVGLFKVPSDFRRPLWLKFLRENGRPDVEDKKCYRLCEKHFKESDINRKSSRIMISRTAVPCFGVRPQATFSIADEIKLEDGEGFLILEEDFSGDFYCRCCFKIFTLNSKFRELSLLTISLVEEFLGLELNFDEGSKQICDECHETLQNFSNFKTQTRRKQKHFSNLILRNEHRDVKKIEKLSENLDEIEMEEEVEVKIEAFEMQSNDESNMLNENFEGLDFESLIDKKAKNEPEEEAEPPPKRLKKINAPREKLPRTYCEACKLSFADIIAHRIKYHNLKHRFECSQCKFITFDQQAFKNHLKVNHKPKVEGKVCPHCAAIILNSLDDHIAAIHQNVRNFFCDLCPYSSYLKNSLANHMAQNHLSVKPFVCDRCGYTTSQARRLRIHNRNVHEEVKKKEETESIPCVHADCKVTFLTSKARQRHIQRCHEGDRKFKCEDPGCNMMFFNKFEMKVHFKRRHGGERNFVCETCGVAYPTVIDLKSHMMSHKDPKHSCPHCEKKFATNWKLTRHIGAVHDHVVKFNCGKCGEGFFRRNHYEWHLLKHLGLKIKCGVEGCSSEFTRRDTYVEHLRYAHKLSEDEKKKMKAKLVEFLSSLKLTE